MRDERRESCCALADLAGPAARRPLSGRSHDLSRRTAPPVAGGLNGGLAGGGVFERHAPWRGRSRHGEGLAPIPAGGGDGRNFGAPEAIAAPQPFDRFVPETWRLNAEQLARTGSGESAYEWAQCETMRDETETDLEGFGFEASWKRERVELSGPRGLDFPPSDL